MLRQQSLFVSILTHLNVGHSEMWVLINHLISPKKFFQLSRKCLPLLCIVFIVSFSYGLIDGLFYAPADYLQGDAYRIMYVHVPCAFLSLFVYGLMSVAAVGVLVWQLKMAPLVIKHSAPLGAGFTLLALITGSIWGRPMWGTWWIWDARLTSELILLFIYVGIMLFQSAVSHKRSGARTTAILVLVGSVDLPIIHYSVNWWQTLHQGSTLKLFAPSAIDATMLYPLLAMIVAALSYFALVLMIKIHYDLAATAGRPHWLQKG